MGVMREHSIVKVRALIEARKMKKSKKVKPAGAGMHLASNIFKRAKTRGLKPGRYDIHGTQIHVLDDGQVYLTCPDCGLEMDDYLDFAHHQKAYH